MVEVEARLLRSSTASSVPQAGSELIKFHSRFDLDYWLRWLLGILILALEPRDHISLVDYQLGL